MQSLINRLFEILFAFRQWAIGHPVEYSLIYSKPIPDYHPVPGAIEPSIEHIPTVVMGILVPLWQQGVLKGLPNYGVLPIELEQNFTALRKATGYLLPIELLHSVMVIWGRLHGLVMLEIFGHLHQSIQALDVLYRFEVGTILKDLGLGREKNDSENNHN